MSAAKSLLQRIGTRGITEIALVSGQVARGGAGEAPIALDAVVHTADDVLQILFEAGGSRHVDNLGEKPSHWTTRLEGVGLLDVTATMHGDLIQARFTLRHAKGPSLTPTPAPAPPRPAPPRPMPAVSFAPLQPQGQTPVSFFAATQPPPPPPPPRPPLDSSELSFDFALDEAPRRRPVAIPTPPPARMPLDTPFSDLGPFAEAIPQAAPPPASPPAPPPAPRSASPHTAAAFKELLLTARSLRASDLHLVAGRPPAYRIAGELVARGAPLDPQRLAEMVLPRVPQRLLATLERDGSADFALEEPGAGRFRVNVGRQRTGLKAAFRLIPGEIPTLDSLGLPDAIGLATQHHQGLIVITGPTGHGKTTTLAAIVDILNRETARHVITVEDPVELVHPRKKAMMSQREVGTHTRSFQSALKASLREDPDVIVVGELRDTETVRMALAASETGHLVLGTMNTPSAAKTIDRIIDLFPPGDQAQVRVTLAGGLRLIVGQRLLPNHDRTALVAAAELLPGSIALWNLIRDGRTFQIPSLQQRGKGLGIIRLDDSLAALVNADQTTLEAALAIAEAPAELEARVKGQRAFASPPEPAAPFDSGAPDRVSTGLNPPRQGLFERAGAILGKRGT
jgi:twitching motility protein PilT